MFQHLAITIARPLECHPPHETPIQGTSQEHIRKGTMCINKAKPSFLPLLEDGHLSSCRTAVLHRATFAVHCNAELLLFWSLVMLLYCHVTSQFEGLQLDIDNVAVPDIRTQYGWGWMRCTLADPHGQTCGLKVSSAYDVHGWRVSDGCNPPYVDGVDAVRFLDGDDKSFEHGGSLVGIGWKFKTMKTEECVCLWACESVCVAGECTPTC